MSVETRSPTKIFTPSSLGELLNYYRDHPQARLFAGGTYLLRRIDPRSRLGGELIDLGHVPELAHISRTERYMEIGSTVPISKIMNTGRHVMSRALYTSLSTIGGMALRNHATLGGNICAPHHRLSTYPVLLLLDVRLELRKAGAGRWITLNRFLSNEGTPLLEEGELVSRIRIPFLNWDIEEFRHQGRIFSPDNFVFCGVARRQKEVISDLRTSYCIASSQLIRARAVEAELIGRKLPFSPDERKEVSEMLKNQLERTHADLEEFHRDRVRRSFGWFLRTLNESV